MLFISNKLKIFWQETCNKCPIAKALGRKLEKEENKKVEYFDVKSPEGLAEAVMFDVMATPSLVITDDNNNEIKSWHGEIPKDNEIKELLE